MTWDLVPLIAAGCALPLAIENVWLKEAMFNFFYSMYYGLILNCYC